MKYFIGADHAGIEIKAFVKDLFEQRGHEVEDLGPYNKDRVDYPDFAAKVCKKVLENSGSMGILICGSGNGINMTVNKHQFVRGALCWTSEIAQLAREHNDANILALPARFISNQEALDIVKTFFSTPFMGDRHERRINKIPMCK